MAVRKCLLNKVRGRVEKPLVIILIGLKGLYNKKKKTPSTYSKPVKSALCSGFKMHKQH